MLVTDRRIAGGAAALIDAVARAVASAVAGGVTAVQMRERGLATRELLALATELRAITRDGGARLVVNDRVDVALAAGADGVQLGFRSMTPADVRRVAGDALAIGRSVHDLEEVRAACAEGADWLIFGPVHATPSKVGLVAPAGVEGLRAAVAAAGSVPVVAIGGLDSSNAAAARAAGAAGVAAIRAILAGDDPAASARAMSGS